MAVAGRQEINVQLLPRRSNIFLHTPQKLHLFDGTPGQEGHVGFVFCFKKIVFIGQNKNQYEGLIVGVYYLAKVYFHLLSAGPVGHDDLCHIVAPFLFLCFIDSAFPAS